MLCSYSSHEQINQQTETIITKKQMYCSSSRFSKSKLTLQNLHCFFLYLGRQEMRKLTVFLVRIRKSCNLYCVFFDHCENLRTSLVLTIIVEGKLNYLWNCYVVRFDYFQKTLVNEKLVINQHREKGFWYQTESQLQKSVLIDYSRD